MIATKPGSVVPWFGGKARITDQIIALFPPHDTYVEVCGGAANVLLNKPAASLDVYNDVDVGLTNFFKVLRNDEQAERLRRLLDLTPYSRAEWQYCRDHWWQETDPVEKARQWAVVGIQGFAGPHGKAWGFVLEGKKQDGAKATLMTEKWQSHLDRLPLAIARFKKVQIDEVDAVVCVKRYNKSPRVMYYADPPYPKETRRDGKYAHEMSHRQHIKLLKALQEAMGMAVVSSYENELYDRILIHEYGWTKLLISTTASSVARTKVSGYAGNHRASEEQKRIECLYLKPNTILQQAMF